MLNLFCETRRTQVFCPGHAGESLVQGSGRELYDRRRYSNRSKINQIETLTSTGIVSRPKLSTDLILYTYLFPKTKLLSNNSFLKYALPIGRKTSLTLSTFLSITK